MSDARPVAMRDHGMAYRGDIDGLRAVAVLLVVVYHALPWTVPGGFVGVDVFFVISGYLITRIIIEETRAGVFTFRAFYERRIRRLMPALLVVLLATFAAGWFLLFPDQYEALGRSALWVLTFSSNIGFWVQQQNYFAPEAELQPLLHTWSLAIEEQFYILMPVLLIVLARFRLRVMAAVLAAGFLYGEATPLPSCSAALPCLGAVAVILAGGIFRWCGRDGDCCGESITIDDGGSQPARSAMSKISSTRPPNGDGADKGRQPKRGSPFESWPRRPSPKRASAPAAGTAITAE